MHDSDSYYISPGTSEFQRICEEMNRLEVDMDAQPTCDGMSGGFKFPDEVPKTLCAHATLSLPLVTVLRSLWGYRISLVQSRPRVDLELWWTEARKLAPKWPGFSEARCSTSMLAIAEWCNSSAVQLSDDMEKLGQ